MALYPHTEFYFITKYITLCIVTQKSLKPIPISQTIFETIKEMTTEIDQGGVDSEQLGQFQQGREPPKISLITLFPPSQVLPILTPAAPPTRHKLLLLFLPHLHPGLSCMASISHLSSLLFVLGHKPTGLGIKSGDRDLFKGINALATGDSYRRRTATLGTSRISMSNSSKDICMQSAIF